MGHANSNTMRHIVCRCTVKYGYVRGSHLKSLYVSEDVLRSPTRSFASTYPLSEGHYLECLVRILRHFRALLQLLSFYANQITLGFCVACQFPNIAILIV